MSQTFEISLRSTFERMQLLEKKMQGQWIRIYYQERGSNGPFKSILTPISGNYYPTVYKVQYTMPMYVDVDKDTPKLDSKWSQALIYTLSEGALLGNDSIGVGIEGGSFPPRKRPFNKHVSNGWICCGNFWPVSREQGGLWYFVQIVGALLNLDRKWMDTDGGHLNTRAAQWWQSRRHYKPTNNIQWVFNLQQIAAEEHDRPPKLVIVSSTIAKPKFTIK